MKNDSMKRFVLRSLYVLILALLLFGCGGTGGGTGGGTDGGTGGGTGGGPVTKIAFESYRDGNYEIYVMNADGSNQVRLTNNLAPDRFPAWSPDGTKIAFESYRDGNSEIYVMNADGSNQVRLTNNSAGDGLPAWSQ